ncbi:phosphoribosylanthranilate isomerase [Dokdonella sp.]|uniref:phosphoribosylanthranilate isomerase n=1 Tax=Dokdonella sp. TaxID=2291710 RepID=UPI003527CD05
MTRMRIKFCGITRQGDAQVAADLGVDALGFVFTRGSRRFVEPDSARAIIRALPAFITAVALFMDDEPAWVREVTSIVNPSLLQFHGEEAVADCAGYGKPFIKAVPMASVADVASYAASYPGASGFLLDAHRSGEPGGQGLRFDWSRRPLLEQPLILAGGLDAANVAAAIRQMRPYAVDVSSGIESAPGIKDAERMRAFVAAVRAVETD